MFLTHCYTVLYRMENTCFHISLMDFYQVQTQMHVTCLIWCDFVVWSPTQDPFVQRVQYDASFTNVALLKACSFYFDKFLLSAVPYVIISPYGTNRYNHCSLHPSTCKQVNKASKFIHWLLNRQVNLWWVQLILQYYQNSIEHSNTWCADHRAKPQHTALIQRLECELSLSDHCLYQAVAHQVGLIN